jgi:hypothetical protein
MRPEQCNKTIYLLENVVKTTSKLLFFVVSFEEIFGDFTSASLWG